VTNARQDPSEHWEWLPYDAVRKPIGGIVERRLVLRLRAGPAALLGRDGPDLLRPQALRHVAGSGLLLLLLLLLLASAGAVGVARNRHLLLLCDAPRAHGYEYEHEGPRLSPSCSYS